MSVMKPTAGLGLLALASLLTAASCAEEPVGFAANPGAWELIWSDEFEGASGELPDATRWQFDVGTNWGNDQLEFDTDRPENVSLDGDGRLRITARLESYEGQPYTSGRIKTKDLFEREGGRFAARIRLPAGQGIWPAFWMLGASYPEVSWPESGEIDVMEYRGQEPTKVFGTVHGPGYSGGDALTGVFHLQDGRFDSDFHVFSVEWYDGDIVWYVDDMPYHRVRRGDVPGPWVFDQPFFLLLNVAVGGGFVGPPGANTVFPQTMLVDWVRVYRRRS